MPITSSEITYRLSGGASNTDPNASLGGAKSSTVMSNNLFDDVSGAEAASGDVEYRCVYVNNANSTLSYISAKIWIQTNTPSSFTDIAIGLGSSGLNGTEQTVANENTAPTGVTFSSPTDFTSGLTLGTIPSNQHYAVWVRRTVSAGAVATNDSFTLRVQGDTNP